MKPELKVPGAKRLKLKYDKLLSNVAFKFNLCRYIPAGVGTTFRVQAVDAYGNLKVRQCRLKPVFARTD